MSLEVLEESGMANNTIVIFTSEQDAQFPGCKPMLSCTITYGATSWSQATEELLTEKDEGQPLYADSAYTGEEQEKVYKKNKVINKVIEKGYRNKPLSEKQKASNKEKSGTRARAENLFGFVENSMNGSFVRTIGLARAKAKIGMIHPVG